MRIGRERISAMIPHGAPMCLLEEVLEWDHERLLCRAVPEREGGVLRGPHPLRSTLLIEYAAQAAAVHQALQVQDGQAAKPAYLGAVKQVELFRALAENGPDLVIEVLRVLAQPGGAIYDVRVTQGTPLLQGRLLLGGQ